MDADGTAGKASADVIPAPARVSIDEGNFAFNARAAIFTGRPFRKTAEYLSRVLSPAAGLQVKDLDDPNQPPPCGSVMLATGDPLLGEEGYQLDVRTDRILIRAAGPAGAFYACQTLRQLLPPQEQTARSVRCLRVEDRPRFPWRGLMLDPAREFLTPDFIKRYIDLLAYHKMNRLHLHLTDDQAWTLEIRKYPQLTDVGRWEWKDADRARGVYSRRDIREIVEYAADRHVVVIPELEMPAHAITALVTLPELMCPDNPWRTGGRKWNELPEGTAEFCMGSERTFRFFEDVLAEVMELFPSPWIHIGGDECYGISWAQCPLCRARQAELAGKDSPDVAALFACCKGDPKKYLLYRDGMRRVAAYVTSRGRTPVMWDDMSWQGHYPPGTLVHQWHYAGGHDYWQNVSTPCDPGVEAAETGHDVLVSSFSHLYFDYPMTDIPLEKVYAFEPLSPLLKREHRQRIIGAHAPVWNQRQENVDAQTFPRLCALAEVDWSPAGSRNLDDFLCRMKPHKQRLASLGVHYGPEASPHEAVQG